MGVLDELDYSGVKAVGGAFVRPDTLNLLRRDVKKDDRGNNRPVTVVGGPDKIEAIVTDGETSIKIVFHRD